MKKAFFLLLKDPKKFVRKVFQRLFSARQNKYPFLFKEPLYNCRFEINNHIEEFRICSWGGEKDYVTSIIEYLEKDDIFFDIGASVGLVSILAAKKLSKGKVYSFEPDPENRLRLIKNYTLNGLTNYHIQPFAIGEKEDLLSLYTAGSNDKSPSLKQVNGIDSFIEVEVKSIDDLIDKKSLPVPTVIKIDIEGAELMALRGMFNTLTGYNRPRLIFIEIHPKFLGAFGANEDQINDLIAQTNYTLVKSNTRDEQILCTLFKKD